MTTTDLSLETRAAGEPKPDRDHLPLPAAPALLRAETPHCRWPWAWHGVLCPEKEEPRADLSRPLDPLSGPQNWNPAQPGLGLGHSGFGGSPLDVPWRLRLQGGKLCGDSRVLVGC